MKMTNRKKTEKIDVSIIISVYNAADRIEEVSHALLNLDHDSYEIILVDDGSRDKSFSIMKRLAKENPLIRVFSQKNLGASAGRNLGIRKARGKYLVLTDDDVLLERDWLKKTMPLLKDPKVGFVASVIKNKVPEGLSKFERLLFDYAQASRDANKNNEGHMLMTNAIRRDTLIDAGSYDPIFSGSGAGADMDLFSRIRRAGYEYRISGAKSVHLEGRKRFKLGFFLKKPYSWGKSLCVFFKKEGMMNFLRGDYRLIFLVFPVTILVIMAIIILSIINLYSLVLIPIFLIAYLMFRKTLVSGLFQRGHNIAEISLVVLIDMVRVVLYNMGALYEFLSFRRYDFKRHDSRK